MRVVPLFRLQEKPHLVNRLTNLTPEQKQEINTFFASHRNLENQIDWNLGQHLTYDYFKKVMDANANSSKNLIKQQLIITIPHVVKNQDYGVIDTGRMDIQGFVPYNHEASNALHSTAVVGASGDWCIAYDNNDTYWKDYTGRGMTFLILLFPKIHEKYAFQIKGGDITVWTKENRSRDLGWFCRLYNLEPGIIKQWCKQAVRLGDDNIDRVATYTELDQYWQVSHEQDHIEIIMYLSQNEVSEDGDTIDTGHGVKASANMWLIHRDNPPPPALERAMWEKGFNWKNGVGLFFQQTSELGFSQALRITNQWDGEWVDPYTDDAKAEIYQYVHGQRHNALGNKERKKFYPDYVVFDDTDLSTEDDLLDVVADALKVSTQVFHFGTTDTTELDGFTLYRTNPDYDSRVERKEPWEGLDMNVPREDDHPNQQYMDFGEAIRRMLGDPERKRVMSRFGL